MRALWTDTYRAILMLIVSAAIVMPASAQDSGWQSIEDFGLSDADFAQPGVQPQPRAQTSITAPQSAPSTLPAQSQFRINDIARITVANVDTITGDYPVNGLGVIDMPLIGMIKIQGLDATQVADTLTALYGRDYLNDPVISVQRQTLAIGKVMIGGHVNVPGVYDLPDYQPLSTVLGLAGGMKDSADHGDIIVLRSEDGLREPYSVNYVRVAMGAQPDPIMAPMDFIYVKKDGETVTREQMDATLRFLKIPLAATLK